MNRFNFGNQITNGMQILSVAGTTAAGFENQSKRAKLADASSGLNNLVDTEGMSPKDAFNAKLGAAKEIGEMRASQLREELDKFHEKQEGIDVDSIMQETDTGIKLKSPQAKALEQKKQNDMDWYNTWVKGKKSMSNKFKSELKKKLAGGNTNADV